MWGVGVGSGKAWGEDHRRKAPAKGRVWGRGEGLNPRWRPGLGLGLRLGLGRRCRAGCGWRAGWGLGWGCESGAAAAVWYRAAEWIGARAVAVAATGAEAWPGLRGRPPVSRGGGDVRAGGEASGWGRCDVYVRCRDVRHNRLESECSRLGCSAHRAYGRAGGRCRVKVQHGRESRE